MTDRELQEITGTIVEFVGGLDARDVPSSVVHEVKRSFVDSVGCIAGGSQHQAVARATAALSPFFGAPQASLFGQRAKADVLHAALINGLAGASYSYFDSFSPAHLHAGVAHTAGLLALSERVPVAGPEFLSALVAGLEVACRITSALALPPAEADIGWSVGGIVCGLSTALSAGKLLGLDRSQLTWALGIAASEAAGTRSEQGAMSAGLIYGQAAQTGIRAALMASGGFTGSSHSLEARHGYLGLFSRKPHANALVADLGEVYLCTGTTYKPFPTDIAIHPGIDAMLRLTRAHGVSSKDIRSIRIEASGLAAQFCDRPTPVDELEAKFSLQHWLAAAAVHGSAGVEQGRLDVVQHPEVVRLRAVTSVIEASDLAWDATRLTAELADGRELHQEVDHCLGSPEAPMPDADLDDKFAAQATPAIGRERAVDLVVSCWHVETLEDVAALARMAC